MPLFEKERPYHGVLGYSGKYPGDDPGAAIVKRFTDLIQRDVDLPIVHAWKKANDGQPYGAFILTAAKGDNMRKWVSEKGLTVPAASTAVTYFDPAHKNGRVYTITREIDAIFHMSDDRPIVEPNNSIRLVQQKQFGLIPSQKGSLTIHSQNSHRFGPGKKMRVVFYYWRPTKLRVNLPKLLQFDESSGRIRFLTDQNAPEQGFDARQPSGRIDAFEYTIGDSELTSCRLPYTVVGDAHSNKDFHTEAEGVFGRFHVGISLQDSNGKFEKYQEIYFRGAYLGAP